MKLRVILAVMVIAAVFSSITFFHGTAQSGSGPGMVPGRVEEPTKPVKRTKSPNPQGSLSDLRVDQVWLDAQSRINFRLRNAGKYAMPDRKHQQGIVRVYFGKSHEDFFLGKASTNKKDPVDQKGALKRVGRSLAYNTKIVLTERLMVKAYVGYINRIAMADRRKGKSLTLLSLIGIKPKAGKKKKPGEDVVDVEPKIEEEKKPGDYISTPTLVVKDIYRDYQDCKVVVVLANEGEVEIPPEIYKGIYVFINFDNNSVKYDGNFCPA